MEIRTLWIVLVVACCVASGCRSDFEKVRLSNNPDEIYTAANKYYDKGEYLRALTLYELILSQFRGRPEAEELFFRYAYAHYYMKQYTLAAHYFESFSNTFGYSEKREEADFMTAFSSYQLSPSFRLEQSETHEAIEKFQEYVNRYPESPRVPECNRLIDELRAKLEDKAFSSAQLYFDMQRYEAAIQSFENMLRDFPDTHRGELVRYRIVEAAYLYATISVYERRKERYEAAVEKYMDYVRKFPTGKYLTEVETIYQKSQEQIQNLNQ